VHTQKGESFRFFEMMFFSGLKLPGEMDKTFFDGRFYGL
jgi:hypothetical protein